MRLEFLIIIRRSGEKRRTTKIKGFTQIISMLFSHSMLLHCNGYFTRKMIVIRKQPYNITTHTLSHFLTTVWSHNHPCPPPPPPIHPPHDNMMVFKTEWVRKRKINSFLTVDIMQIKLNFLFYFYFYYLDAAV